MRNITALVVSLVLLGLAGCAPRVDVAADEAAVKKLFDDSTATLNANDARITDFNTEDAVVMYADGPAAIGKPAIKERQRVIWDQAAFQETRSLEEVIVSGDLAFVRWTGRGTMTPKDGSAPSEFDRKGITIFQRQPDNSWKTARVIWNSNRPVGE